MPSTLVRRSATGSEKERMIDTWPAIWQTASSPRANAGSTSAGRVTSARAYQAPAGTFSRRPLDSLSTTETACPSASNRRLRWEPMNPAPPVTSILISAHAPLRRRRLAVSGWAETSSRYRATPFVVSVRSRHFSARRSGCMDQAPTGSLASNFSKYAMVFVRPSRNGTIGRQSSNSCALLMSGLRCLGSSVGSGR